MVRGGSRFGGPRTRGFGARVFVDEKQERDGNGGGGYVYGLLTGAVIGAGLGMLFAPVAGAKLRRQLGERASTLANTASEGYRRVADASDELAGRGRDLYEKARDIVSTGAEAVQRQAQTESSSRASHSDFPGVRSSDSTPRGGSGRLS